MNVELRMEYSTLNFNYQRTIDIVEAKAQSAVLFIGIRDDKKPKVQSTVLFIEA